MTPVSVGLRAFRLSFHTLVRLVVLGFLLWYGRQNQEKEKIVRYLFPPIASHNSASSSSMFLS
jgi:hypothetical protein